MRVANLCLADIKVGKTYQFIKKFSKEDILKFANLTGDFNPLHTDKEFGEKSQFKTNIVFGMLAGSLFSTLVGMHCPGKHALYLSQTLQFRLPVYFDDVINVKGTVMAINEFTRLITLKTEIIKEGKICINGEAKVKLLEN